MQECPFPTIVNNALKNLEFQEWKKKVRFDEAMDLLATHK